VLQILGSLASATTDGSLAGEASISYPSPLDA